MSAVPTLPKTEAPALTREPSKTLERKPSNDNEELGVEREEPDELAEAHPIPWQYKWIALLLVATMPLGSNWNEATLSPLKNTLRNELGIDNTQYAVISAGDAIINAIWPLFGGMLLDWYGTNVMTIICSTTITVGAVLTALGVSISGGSWRVLAAGQIVMGLGQSVLDMAQQKFFYHWFGASGFAFAYGLENAGKRITGLVAGMVAIPIRDSTGWYGWPIWIPAAMCVFSFLVNIAYLFFERWYIPKRHRLTSARSKALLKNKQSKFVSFSSLRYMPWAYLMLPCTQLLQSGAAGGFQKNAPDIIRMKGFTEAVAGFMSSGAKAIPIIMSPLVGWLLDRYGHRFHVIASAPLLFILCNVLIVWTSTHPLVAVVIQNIANGLNGMPLNVTFPLLIADIDKIGTGYGIWRCFNNGGGAAMEVAFGMLQDKTTNMGYERVLALATGIKAWGFFVAVGYIIVDYRFLGRGITMTREKRLARLKELEGKPDEADPLTRRTSWPWLVIVTIGLLSCLITTAWVLFFLGLTKK